MVNKIPKWLSNKISLEGLQKIEAKIAQAERSTSGEIVPMIVKSSSTIGHVPVIIFCLTLILFMGSGLADYQAISFEFTSPLWWLLNLIIFSFLANFLARFHFIQRHLTSNEDLDKQVTQKAEIEFFEQGLTNTKGGTGVLIYLSLMEKKVVVLADKSISDKLSQDTWSELVDLIVSGVKKKNLSLGFCKAIEKSGQLLAPHFPRRVDDTNELRNRIIIKE